MVDKTIKIEVNRKVIHSIIHALGHVNEKMYVRYTEKSLH